MSPCDDVCSLCQVGGSDESDGARDLIRQRFEMSVLESKTECRKT